MALLSKSCEYGLRAVIYIHAHGKGDYVSIRSMARDLDISFHFLTKILQRLTRSGILKSYRGPGGGIALARSPSTISMYDIVTGIDDEELFKACALGLKKCGDRKPCPLHKTWSTERKRIAAMFRSASLDKLGRPVAEGLLRLQD